MSAPIDTGGSWTSPGGGAPSGGTGFDPYGVCNLGIELQYLPSKTGMYAIICRYVGPTLYILSITENAWFDSDTFATTKTYTDACVSLTENTNMVGNYTASVPAFSVGDGATYTSGMVFIEYWVSAGGSPDRTLDTNVGTQLGYFDDARCTWYDSREEWEIRTHTVDVQQGDDSNTNIHTDNLSCCERIAFIEDMVRQILNRIGLQRAGKG